MPLFRERLWPSPWVFLATALVIPASLLVFLPINPVAGVIVAILLYVGCVVLLILASPVIEVSSDRLHAGRANVDLEYLGTPTVFTGAEAVAERGPRLDARAWLLIRGWVGPVVKIPILDDADPTPYWLLSTRRPGELVSALQTLRTR